MPNQQKKIEVEKLTSLISENDVFFLTDYRGLKVSEFEEFRNTLRKTGVTVRVAKNRLLKHAWQFAEKDKLDSYLQEPTAIVLAGSDPVTPAQVIKQFNKDYGLPKVKAIIVEDNLYDGDTFEKFASMDSPQELKGKLVNVLASPMSGMLSVLNGLPRNLVYALGQIRDNKSQGN